MASRPSAYDLPVLSEEGAVIRMRPWFLVQSKTLREMIDPEGTLDPNSGWEAYIPAFERLLSESGKTALGLTVELPALRTIEAWLLHDPPRSEQNRIDFLEGLQDSVKIRLVQVSRLLQMDLLRDDIFRAISRLLPSNKIPGLLNMFQPGRLSPPADVAATIGILPTPHPDQ
jgi:hypothetical protein